MRREEREQRTAGEDEERQVEEKMERDQEGRGREVQYFYHSE